MEICPAVEEAVNKISEAMRSAALIVYAGIKKSNVKNMKLRIFFKYRIDPDEKFIDGEVKNYPQGKNKRFDNDDFYRYLSRLYNTKFLDIAIIGIKKEVSKCQ